MASRTLSKLKQLIHSFLQSFKETVSCSQELTTNEELTRYIATYNTVLLNDPPLSFHGRTFGTTSHVPLEILHAISEGIMRPSSLEEYQTHITYCVHCQRNLALLTHKT